VPFFTPPIVPASLDTLEAFSFRLEACSLAGPRTSRASPHPRHHLSRNRHFSCCATMKMETRKSDILSNSRFSHRNPNWLNSVNFGAAIPQRWFMRDPWALRLPSEMPLAPLYVLLCLIISGEPVKTLSNPGLCSRSAAFSRSLDSSSMTHAK